MKEKEQSIIPTLAEKYGWDCVQVAEGKYRLTKKENCDGEGRASGNEGTEHL